MNKLAQRILFIITFVFFFYLSFKVVQSVGNYLFMRVAYSYELLISMALIILGIIISMFLAYVITRFAFEK